MKTIRKGLGQGKGKGYYNLIKGYDSYIHTLSAKGIRTRDYKKYNLYKLERWAENADDEERGSYLRSEELHIVPEDKEDEFGEWMADEYGYQDYSNKIQLVKLGQNITGEELKEIYKKYKEQKKKKLDARGQKWKVTKDDYDTLIANREGFIKVEKELLNKYPQLTEGEINSIILKDPEEFINLDKQSNVKIGDKIDVNDYGIGKIVQKPTYKNGTIVKKVKGSVAVHLVVEEDKSVRWYINPDESRGDLILDTQYIIYIGER